MSRFLLDTNILSSLINRRGGDLLQRRLAEADPERVCTSVVVAAELR